MIVSPGGPQRVEVSGSLRVLHNVDEIARAQQSVARDMRMSNAADQVHAMPDWEIGQWFRKKGIEPTPSLIKGARIEADRVNPYGGVKSIPGLGRGGRR